LGPYVFSDCCERNTEARITVGCSTRQSQVKLPRLESYLGLPYGEGRSGKSSEHVAASRCLDRNDLAMHIVLCQWLGGAGLSRWHAIVLVQFVVLLCGCPIVRRCLGIIVRCALVVVWSRAFSPVVGQLCSFGLRVLGSREDRGGGNGPIRHGGLRAIGGCICAAHHIAGCSHSRSSFWLLQGRVAWLCDVRR
jgi:hypothetical protein